MPRITRAERNRYRTDGEYCFRCGDRLNPTKSVYLVLSCRTSEFYATDEEAEATGCNQGGFPFGPACAKAQLRETAAKVKATAPPPEMTAAGVHAMFDALDKIRRQRAAGEEA